MLRIEGRSHAAHRGAEPCCAWTAALTRGELRAPDLLRQPIPYSPPAHVCTPGVWNGRREFKGGEGRGITFATGMTSRGGDEGFLEVGTQELYACEQGNSGRCAAADHSPQPPVVFCCCGALSILHLQPRWSLVLSPAIKLPFSMALTNPVWADAFEDVVVWIFCAHRSGLMLTVCVRSFRAGFPCARPREYRQCATGGSQVK